MALGSNQLQTEMSTRDLIGDKGRPASKAENLTAIGEPIVLKMWEPRRLTTLWASTACYRDSFTFSFFIIIKGIGWEVVGLDLSGSFDLDKCRALVSTVTNLWL
jgi:hypothetical protein